MKTYTQKFKFIALVAALAFGGHLVAAQFLPYQGPTAPAPGNNVSGIIDTTDQEQAKGYNSFTPGVKLDIDKAGDPSDIFSSQNLGIFSQIRVGRSLSGDTYVNSLPGPNSVCANDQGTLVICPPSVATPAAGSGGTHHALLTPSGVAVNVTKNCLTPVTVYIDPTSGSDVTAGTHVWEDIYLQTPYSGTTIQNTYGNTYPIVPGYWTNTVRAGSQVVSC